jgi:hypothetical protein
MRNRPLRPTLRVATSFDAQEAAMYVQLAFFFCDDSSRAAEKEEEKLHRIHDAPFTPFSHTQELPYMVHTDHDSAVSATFS